MSTLSTFFRTLHPEVLNSIVQLGFHLKGARKRRRWTLSQFAQKVGVAKSTLQRMENGDPAVSLGVFVNAIFMLGLDAEIKNLLIPEKDTRGFIELTARLPKRIRKTALEKNKLDF